MPDGTPEPLPQPGPRDTPRDEVLVGTKVIPGQGLSPPPTLTGIAVEVGKIERKLELVLTQPPSGGGEGPPLDLAEVLDLLRELLGLVQRDYPAGSYSLVPVCEERGPAVASWPAGRSPLGEVNAKLNAMASLLQAHKDMRQPICRQKASGEEVTVIFEEI
jgi:hypothetical protein